LAGAIPLALASGIWLARPQPAFDFLGEAEGMKTRYADPTLAGRSGRFEDKLYTIRTEWKDLIAQAKPELLKRGYKQVFWEGGPQKSATSYGPDSHVSGLERVSMWSHAKAIDGRFFMGPEHEGWVTIQVIEPRKTLWEKFLRVLRLR
jgi:hypothetical protein